MTVKDDDQLYNEINRGMALAFFASAYADQAESNNAPLRGEIMDQLPEAIDPAAEHAAYTLICAMQLHSRLGVQPKGIERLYEQAVALSGDGDREITPELFGHYCAMQAMGHGVGLESFGQTVHDAIYVPYVEFGDHSLQVDYFLDPDDDEA